MADAPSRRPRASAVLAELAAAAPETLTTAALAERTGLDRAAVARGCDVLRRRQLARRRRAGVWLATEAGIELAAAGGRVQSGPQGPETRPRAPRRDSLRQRAWQAMRLMRKFCIPELLEMVCGDDCDERAATRNLQRYLHALARTGFLGQLPTREGGTAPTSPGFKRWLLLRDSGPAAPVLQDGGRVRDPNGDGAVHEPEARP